MPFAPLIILQGRGPRAKQEAQPAAIDHDQFSIFNSRTKPMKVNSFKFYCFEFILFTMGTITAYGANLAMNAARLLKNPGIT